MDKSYIQKHERIKISPDRLFIETKPYKFGTILFGSCVNAGCKEIHFKVNKLHYMGLCVITNEFKDWCAGDLESNIFVVTQAGFKVYDHSQFTVLQEPKDKKFEFFLNDTVIIKLDMNNKYAEFKQLRRPELYIKVKIPDDTKCGIAIFLNISSVSVIDQIIT